MATLFTRSLIYVGAVGIAAATGACKKDAAAAADANTTMLAAHSWRIVAYTATDPSTQPPKVEDWYASLATYRKDDTYTFNADNSLVFDDKTVKQNAADPQTAAGSWQFQANQSQLTITLRKTVPLGTIGNTSSTTYTIQELSANTLRLLLVGQTQTVQITLAQ